MMYIETIKVVDGVVFNYEYHKQRAFQTSGIILPEIIIPDDRREGVVKCRIVYNTEIVSIEYIPYTYPVIQSLKIVEADSFFYDKKYLDRSRLNQFYQNKGDADDILITVNGMLTDTSFCNIVLESEDDLFTPATPMLYGTQRAFLIDQQIITPRQISIDDLSQYKSVRLINAMIGLDHPTTSFPISAILK